MELSLLSCSYFSESNQNIRTNLINVFKKEKVFEVWIKTEVSKIKRIEKNQKSSLSRIEIGAQKV